MDDIDELIKCIFDEEDKEDFNFLLQYFKDMPDYEESE